MSFALLAHLLGVVVWIGGMFFAQFALRPAAATTLEPPQRLSLLAAVFSRFLCWTGIAIVLVLVSGAYLVVAIGGIHTAGVHVHAMIGLGVLMMLIYGHIRFAAYRRLKAAVAATDWTAAGAAMAQIRPLIVVNLVLGLAIICIAVLGRAG